MGTDNTPYQPALPTLRFADEPSRSSIPTTEIIIPYDEKDCLARYTYDIGDGQYKRWYGGAPQLDGITGQRISADNVIILYAQLAYQNNHMIQPLWNLTGEGRLDVFIGGLHIPGIWRRADDASAFEYMEESGEPLLLKPGKTFIQIVPEEMSIYKDG